MRAPLPLRLVPAVTLLSLLAATSSFAMDAVVPTGAFPDIQTAVTVLSGSPDVFNRILIDVPSITTANPIVLTNAFSNSRQLLIRPNTTVVRAQILSQGLNFPIFSLQSCGSVTIQDLDIVRTITNTYDLIQTGLTHGVTIERCRIGSSEPPGPGGLSYISIQYPSDGGVTIRNCIFFSTFKNAFDFGINVLSMSDNTNAVYLYNNCVADYNVAGIQVNDGTNLSLVLLRNNVVVNNTVSLPEPMAMVSAVVGGVIVVTSNNLAFASPGHAQVGSPPNQDIFGSSAVQEPILLPATLADETASFATMTWNPAPGDPNPDFYRTLPTGELHDTSAKWGVNVGLGVPDPHDLGVGDDIVHTGRPGGPVPHTDRGPYQVDPPSSAASVGGAAKSPWSIRPERNPARLLALSYSGGAGGTLRVDLFDTSGRRVGSVERAVGAGEAGVLSMPAGLRAGVYAYRASLRGAGEALTRLSGKVTIVR